MSFINKNKVENLENEFAQTAEAEEKKFSYINPIKNNSMNSKVLYWSSFGERVGRSLIMFARILSLIISIVFIIHFNKVIIANKNPSYLYSAFSKYGIYIILSVILLSIAFSFLYILPPILVKKSSSLHSWGMAYIYFAITYFLFWEAIIIAASVFMGLSNSATEVSSMQLDGITITFMVLIFIITILLIIGGCILIVKSDNAKNQLATE